MDTIWRYMDLWKFESILSKKALFFSTAASQEDGFEGIYPPHAKINRARQIENLPEEAKPFALHNQEVFEQQSKYEIILSCWHINEDENPRMWKEYIQELPGIAIKTSKQSLQDCFTVFSHPHLVTIENVQYVNRTTYRGNLGRPLAEFFLKEESFKWENELRCVINTGWQPLPHQPGGAWNAEYLFPDNSRHVIGYFIPVDVNTLIEKIVVSPGASDEFHEKVENTCIAYGVTKPIEHSNV